MRGIRSFLQPTSASLSGFIYDASCIKMSGTVCSPAPGLSVGRSSRPWGASTLWVDAGEGEELESPPNGAVWVLDTEESSLREAGGSGLQSVTLPY